MDNLKELQNFLNSCIENGRSREGGRPEEFDGIGCHDGFLVMNLKPEIDIDPIDMDGYHWLFSKDSGLMEFVQWKHKYYGSWCFSSSHYKYHLQYMGNMKAEEKILYFLENALLPEQKDNE